jgi:hypothetical protein
MKTLHDLGLGEGVKDQVDIQRTVFELDGVSFFHVVLVEAGVVDPGKSQKGADLIFEARHQFLDGLEGVLLAVAVQQANRQGEIYFFTDIHFGYGLVVWMNKYVANSYK